MTWFEKERAQRKRCEFIPFAIPSRNPFDCEAHRFRYLTIGFEWESACFEKRFIGVNVLLARIANHPGSTLISRRSFISNDYITSVDPTHIDHFISGKCLGMSSAEKEPLRTPTFIYEIGMGAFVHLSTIEQDINCAFVKSGEITRPNFKNSVCSHIALIAVKAIRIGDVLTANPQVINARILETRLSSTTPTTTLSRPKKIIIDDDDDDSSTEDTRQTQAHTGVTSSRDDFVQGLVPYSTSSTVIESLLGSSKFVVNDPGKKPDAIASGYIPRGVQICLGTWFQPVVFHKTRAGSKILQRNKSLQCYIDGVRVNGGIDVSAYLTTTLKSMCPETFVHEDALPVQFPVAVSTMGWKSASELSSTKPCMCQVELTSEMLKVLLPDISLSIFQHPRASIFMFPGLVTTERLHYKSRTLLVVLTGSVRFAWSTSDEWTGRILEESRSSPALQFASTCQNRDYLFVRKATAGAVVYVWPGTILQCIVTDCNSAFLVSSPELTTDAYSLDYIDVEGKFVVLGTGCGEGHCVQQRPSKRPRGTLPSQLEPPSTRPANPSKRRKVTGENSTGIFTNILYVK